MGTDAFLDLDVIARNPEPYRLLGQLEPGDLYRTLNALAQAEAKTTVAFPKVGEVQVLPAGRTLASRASPPS